MKSSLFATGRLLQIQKWIAKLGGWGYDMLILFNRWVNIVLVKMGREKYSLSKRIKKSVKSAVKFISNFEETATEVAIERGMHYVICGHIHQPVIRDVCTSKGRCTYLNSGDWIENLTALEYNNENWRLYEHLQKSHMPFIVNDEDNITEEPFPEMLSAFQLLNDL